MNKRIFISILVLASFFIATGIFFSFKDLSSYKIEPNNSGYVSAVFSLSGVLLYFAALLYQIKEYQLQVEELRKSVEAQTKSSEALDEQKRILLEQSTNSMIFGMIDNFNSFKQRNESQELINRLISFYQGQIIQLWRNNLNKPNLNPETLNIEFARGIKEILSNSVIRLEGYHEFKKYIQFVYNILYLIDSNLTNLTQNIFTPFFFSQLNSKEITMVYLANLCESRMPLYDNINWDYHTTIEIVDTIIKTKTVPTNFSDIDYTILMEEFNKIKQNKIRI
jgi:hypothetical protein